MKENPLISVILPCFNAEQYLQLALESIVNQTYSNLEIILINDGSTDCTEEICLRFKEADSRITYLKNKQNLGLIDTLNKGISVATGDYIARMDADDISHLSRFSLQINFLIKNPSIDLLGSIAQPIDVHGNKLANKVSTTYFEPKTLRFSSYFTQPFFHGSILAKSGLLKTNKYDSNFKHSEDFELWLRLNSKNFTFANIQETLYYYRLNPQGVSINNEKKQIKSHNLASYKYLNKIKEEEINFEITSILNNRPIKGYDYKSFTTALEVFKELYKNNEFTEELNSYYNSQKLNIIIQAFRHTNNLVDKFFIFSVLLKPSTISSTINFLLKKIK